MGFSKLQLPPRRLWFLLFLHYIFFLYFRESKVTPLHLLPYNNKPEKCVVLSHIPCLSSKTLWIWSPASQLFSSYFEHRVSLTFTHSLSLSHTHTHTHTPHCTSQYRFLTETWNWAPYFRTNSSVLVSQGPHRNSP
jgi:hypothetical protein